MHGLMWFFFPYYIFLVIKHNVLNAHPCCILAYIKISLHFMAEYLAALIWTSTPGDAYWGLRTTDLEQRFSSFTAHQDLLGDLIRMQVLIHYYDSLLADSLVCLQDSVFLTSAEWIGLRPTLWSHHSCAPFTLKWQGAGQSHYCVEQGDCLFLLKDKKTGTLKPCCSLIWPFWAGRWSWVLLGTGLGRAGIWGLFGGSPSYYIINDNLVNV